jgi:hypothetical protein
LTKTIKNIFHLFKGSYGDFAELEGDKLCDRLMLDTGRSDCRLSIGSLDMHYDSSGEQTVGSGGGGLSGGMIDRGTGGHERLCLVQSAFNAFLVYECHFFQVFSRKDKED